eukprot:TRINITY_DN8707_c0_g1_i1.p1 TRINITY_DN8707_c0_g1~~TRINITY_DN8707_c0_g1_i1.p1  ORF type:complete len:1487 (-),score=391.90 TRINITY_DN8707_c0_g1_i1:448-4908(-)
MAGDTLQKSEPPKPCCAALEKKLSKSEMGRAALKQAIALYDKKVSELETENLNLKKECERERTRAELEREAKEKECGCRIELENEICNLKSQIASLQKRGYAESEDKEGDRLLETRVLEGEAEIKRLKDLLEKERKRGDSECKKAETEKKKAAEAWKVVKAEKSKAEEEKKLAEIERKKAEECRLCLEATKLEANEAKVKLVSGNSKAEETNRKAEVEKQRANKEKKRADLEAVKAEEQRKYAEVERQKATDEKTHADQLSQLLEEERRRKEALQKEMQELLSCGNMNGGCSCSRDKRCGSIPGDHSEKTDTADKKVLNKQLKLEKMQARQAKKIAKIEKVRNNLLQQELDLLKHDAIQFSRRLDMLDECFSHGMEGIDSIAKIGDSQNRQRINSKNGIPGIEVCDLHCQNENELIKTHYIASDSFDHYKTRGACKGNLLPISGVSCTETASGTNSEMESLIGGSVRSKSQNSAICSTSTSFSDRQLMGSQDGGVFPTTTSPRLTEESSKQGSCFMRLSGGVTKKRFSKNVGEVAENIDTSHLNVKNELGDKLLQHRRKRKRIQDSQESVVYLRSEDKLHMKTEEALSLLHDISDPKNIIPLSICSQSDEDSKLLGNGKCLVLKSSDDLHVKKYKSRKKENVAQKQKHVAQHSLQNDGMKQMDQLEMEGTRDVRFCTGASLTAANHIREADPSCRDRTTNAAKSFTDATIFCEDMFGGDIMKLLELDNDVDEERYRIAMESPMSPTLPEIDFCKLRVPQVDDFNYLVQGHCRGLIMEEVNRVSSHNFDVMDVEIDSNNLHLMNDNELIASFFRSAASVAIEQMHDTEKRHGSMVSADHASSLDLKRSVPIFTRDFQEVPTQNHGTYSLVMNTVSAAWKQNNAVKGTRFNQCQVEDKAVNLSISQSLNDLLESSESFSPTGQDNAGDVLGFGMEKELGKLMPVSTAERMEIDFVGNVGSMQGTVAKFCVVTSNVKDEDNISRIICAIENFSSQTNMVCATHWVVADVLLALAKKQDLMLEEKACVFVSMLLHNMSVMDSENSKSHTSGGFSFCSDSLAIELNRVVSDGETRSLFLELCECNILFNLIESFLIDRTVLVYSCPLLLPSDSGGRILSLRGRTMLISSKTATSNQLETGCVLLASVCTATNNVGFICEVSYNILRMCKDDICWILTALHIFASVCGKKYFEQTNHSSIMTATKSVVLHLERGEKSGVLVSSPYLTSSSGIHPRFISCVQCPFADGAVCMDEVFTVLLENLNEYANLAIRSQYLKKPAISSIDTIQAQRESTEGSLENVNGVNGQNMGLNASGFFSMDKRVAALEADFAADRTSSQFNDTISLVELISCYMDWDWVYNNIIPSLLKLLGSHVSEEFLAAILILTGHVGRLGIDAGGYDQKGLEGLRCSLSAFLVSDAAWEISLPSQFAAAKALTDLLLLEFEELMQKDLDIMGDSARFSHGEIIKKWFSQLSKEQQSLYLNLFQSAIIQNA